MKILLVEDSHATASLEIEAVRHIFTHTVDIIRALDGQAAIERFEQHEINLVLLDWHLPKIEGIDVLKEIRKTNTTVPIIMITCETALESINAAMKAGVTDYVIKPFNIKTLTEKIRKNFTWQEM
ncbi:response regulator transcription factor [Piscirickettsia litoralis]|uniref:Response regulatory domain-containing protein n=1 Tax=Piscirickettsia litoralis TaxID=1891921 RepID=A0ABX3A3B2_9GAMM|nr:response regulator [Piscirickettsia litoralis]ODN42128.1 hypothetical protein BGC07_03165 [Piscirickettsia litoralis]